MATIQQVLQTVYRSSGQRILRDEEYFIGQLVAYYEPSMKQDCKLLERAIRNGAGKIIIQFQEQGLTPTVDENNTFRSMLQRRASFTQPEAERIIDLLYHMVSFPAPSYVAYKPTPVQPPAPTPTPQKYIVSPQQNQNKNTQPKPASGGSFWTLPNIQTLLSIAYVVFIIVSLVSAQKSIGSSDPFSALGGMLSGFLAGKVFGTNLFMMIVGSLFSVVGFFTKKPWAYLTSAIIETVGALMLLTLISIQPLPMLACAGISALGYIAFARLRKNNP